MIINSFTIFVNNECNLDCKYCFVNKSSINLEYSEGIEKIIISILEKTDKLTIGFLGGEPLLNFKFIKKIVYFVEKLKKEYINKEIIIGAITTNGTIYNENIYTFLYKYNIELEFSVDSFLSNNDINRIHKYISNYDIYHIVTKNLLKYKKIYKKNPNISLVVTSMNVNYLYDFVKYLVEEIGSKYITISTVMGKKGFYGDYSLEIFKKEYLKICTYYFKNIIKYNIQIDPIEEVIVELLSPGSSINNLSNCSLWKDLYLGYNGLLYTCTLLAGQGNMKVKNQIFGGIKSGVDFIKLNKGYNAMNNRYKMYDKKSFKEKLDIKKMFCLRYKCNKKEGLMNENIFEYSIKIPFILYKKLDKKSINYLMNRHGFNL